MPRYLEQKVTFEEKVTAEIKNRLKSARAAFHKYRQELTSRSYRLCYRLRFFSMVITPTLTYASGTWTFIKSARTNDQISATNNASTHCSDEETLQSEDKERKRKKTRDQQMMKKNQRMKNCTVSLMQKQKKIRNKAQIATRTVTSLSMKIQMKKSTEEKLKKQTGSKTSKRSTKEAEEHMTKTQIPCWIEAHRRMKWRMALRIASLPQERWISKITEWSPGLGSRIETNRPVGRPRKRWEDEINECLRPEE